jgi:hypothetical protein
MSNAKPRTADIQCIEHVKKVRIRQSRDAADRAFKLHLDQMTRQFGLTLTLGALFRHVGLLIVEGAHSDTLRTCRRYLTQCIVRSICRGLLTRPRMLH